MEVGHQFREAPAHEAEKRLARAVLTGCVVPVLKGLAYAIALFAFPLYLGREIAGRQAECA